MALDGRMPTDEEAEWYASTYVHFLTDVRFLNEEAEVQCVLKQYDNVAWELKDFFLRLAHLVLNLPGGNLSEEQRSAIVRLVNDVSAIPSQVVNVPNTRENHKIAMRDPHWRPVRARAAELLRQLESETKRVDAVLWPNGNV